MIDQPLFCPLNLHGVENDQQENPWRSFFALAIVVLLSHGQTSQDPCPSGTPKCFSDLAPYAGHNLSASQLPPNLCPNGCAGDNRRVIVIRFDPSWGTTTNSNIWDAVQCAAAAWNNATDGASPPNKIGYYLVLDQQNLTNVAMPDITVIKQDIDDLAACNVGHDNENPNRQNVVKLDPVNGDLGVGAGLNFNASDLCGRVAHELGHLMGVGEVGNCKSVMFGTNLNGTRDVDTPQPNDVAQVNRNFDAATRTSCQDTTPTGDAAEPIVNPTPTPTPTPTLCAEIFQSCTSGWQCCSGFCGEWSFVCMSCEENPQDPQGGCMSQACSDCYGQGGTYCTGEGGNCWTPILVDVSGNGFNLTNATNGVNFNDGKGAVLLTAWTMANSDDAWLVIDRNGNGTIDDGTELFGNAAPQPTTTELKNGFRALSEYDKPINGGNQDGRITNHDSVFTALRLWQDMNHDGISQPSELGSLPSLGLTSIDLNYKLSKYKDNNGNTFKFRAKTTDAQGAQLGRWVYDVFLEARRAQ